MALEWLVNQDFQDLLVNLDKPVLEVLKVCQVQLALLGPLDQRASRVIEVQRDREVAKVFKDKSVLQEIQVGTVMNCVLWIETYM